MGAQQQERPLRILIVDDEADTRALIRAMLASSPRPYEVDEAASGDQAFRKVDEFRPDLILLDIVLTDIDGVAILQALKRDPITRNVKVILVTARADDRMVRTGLISGADDYLIKPFPQEKLLGLVERLLSA